MSVAIVMVWQLSVVVLGVTALIATVSAGWWQAISIIAAQFFNQLIDDLLKLED